MQEQVFSSDVVIFNRTDDDTDRGHLRRTIKLSLIHICAKAGIQQEIRKREHYEKPSVRRKKKSEAARKRKYN